MKTRIYLVLTVSQACAAPHCFYIWVHFILTVAFWIVLLNMFQLMKQAERKSLPKAASWWVVFLACVLQCPPQCLACRALLPGSPPRLEQG